ncbi:hypothetical protein C8R45DRAFT_1220639 [Mycena sanguinolenta]|nr:hypothetical protein C8R45DRAFT_1220639 [Mycena sanguinolenta]
MFRKVVPKRLIPTLAQDLSPDSMDSELQSPDIERLADVQDNEHYYSSGDSIIRVENTFFKTHKFHFIHNSPVFATMFTLPSGNGNPEGLSDDHPIVLEGEKAEEFRAVLKYIYSPPIQLQIHSIPVSALPEVVSLAKFSHKYAMDHWKQWALKVVSRQLGDLSSLPTEHLPELYSLFNLLELNSSLRGRITKRWCEVVEKDDLSIAPVLTAADAAGDRDALVSVYSIQIRRWENRPSRSDPESLFKDDISPTHCQRILSGYASLSLSWNRFRRPEPPSIFQDAQCQGGHTVQLHEARCMPYHRTHWSEAILDAEGRYPHLTQMARRLSHVLQHLKDNNPEPSSSSPRAADCFHAVIKRFNDYVQNDAQLLANYFFPTPSS